MQLKRPKILKQIGCIRSGAWGKRFEIFLPDSQTERLQRPTVVAPELPVADV